MQNAPTTTQPGGTGDLPITSLVEAERWLDGLINRERERTVSYARFGLDAIEALLERVDHPERGLSIVHIAGSKGKGSTALFTEAVLLALGEHTGTFTSPHLASWTERFRIDGRYVEPDRLVRTVAALRPHVDALREPGSRSHPSFFDATTAAGLLLFRDANVDRAVLEVGLGGRLDSTNAVAPAVTCITTIEYEHTDKLGDTLAAIAGEKAGILKPGVPCIVGALPDEALRVVLERAAALSAPVRRLGEDFGVRVRTRRGDATCAAFWSCDGFGFDAEIAARGRHQLDNAAVAVEAVRALGAHADDAVADAAARALPRAVLPARAEIVERDPLVVVDAAHTRESAVALRAVLDELSDAPVWLVLSVSADKRLDGILDALIPPAAPERVRGVTVTRAEPTRGASPEALAAAIAARRDDLTVRVVADPVAAVRDARDALPDGCALCVTGSIYLAGIARGVLVRS